MKTPPRGSQFQRQVRLSGIFFMVMAAFAFMAVAVVIVVAVIFYNYRSDGTAVQKADYNVEYQGEDLDGFGVGDLKIPGHVVKDARFTPEPAGEGGGGVRGR